MSSTLTSPAPWNQTASSSHTPMDADSNNVRARRAVARSSNGHDTNSVGQKSTSPAPSGSTVSVRSKAFTRSDSGKMESPEKQDLQLPITTTASISSRSSRRNSKPAAETVEPRKPSRPESKKRSRRTDKSLSPDSAQHWERQELAIYKGSFVFEKTPTPDPDESEIDPVDRREDMISSLKRKLPVEDDDGNAVAGASSYDATPRTSPVLDTDAPSPAVLVNGEAPLPGSSKDGAASKRAPRKKRKWLKRGEVDPDDPVAVAKQKERHVLLDSAEDMLVDQMQDVEDGNHHSLKAMLAELDRRREVQLTRAEARHKHRIVDLERMRDHAVWQARVDYNAADTEIRDSLREDLRRFKHKIINEKTAMQRAFHQNPHPLGDTRRAGRPWGVYDRHLLSEENDNIVVFTMDGETRTLRNHGKVTDTLSREEARNDLRAMKAARDAQKAKTSETVVSTSVAAVVTSSSSSSVKPAKSPYPPARIIQPQEKPSTSQQPQRLSPVRSTPKPLATNTATVPVPSASTHITTVPAPASTATTTKAIPVKSTVQTAVPAVPTPARKPASWQSYSLPNHAPGSNTNPRQEANQNGNASSSRPGQSSFGFTSSHLTSKPTTASAFGTISYTNNSNLFTIAELERKASEEAREADLAARRRLVDPGAQPPRVNGSGPAKDTAPIPAHKPYVFGRRI